MKSEATALRDLALLKLYGTSDPQLWTPSASMKNVPSRMKLIRKSPAKLEDGVLSYKTRLQEPVPLKLS